MDQKRNWLERPIHSSLPALTNEIAIFAVVILLAFVTRFYSLGLRVMSHDESLHTYFSWLLYRGKGYQHSPMMHGPFQGQTVVGSACNHPAFLGPALLLPSLSFIATIWMV